VVFHRNRKIQGGLEAYGTAPEAGKTAPGPKSRTNETANWRKRERGKLLLEQRQNRGSLQDNPGESEGKEGCIYGGVVSSSNAVPNKKHLHEMPGMGTIHGGRRIITSVDMMMSITGERETVTRSGQGVASYNRSVVAQVTGVLGLPGG